MSASIASLSIHSHSDSMSGPFHVAAAELVFHKLPLYEHHVPSIKLRGTVETEGGRQKEGMRKEGIDFVEESGGGERSRKMKKVREVTKMVREDKRKNSRGEKVKRK